MAEAQPAVGPAVGPAVDAAPPAPAAPQPSPMLPGAPVGARLDGLSADDLLQELRARAGEGGTPRESLREVEAADIAQQLKFLQRRVYRPDDGQDFTIFGADDRRDLFQFTDSRMHNDADCVVAIVHQNNLVAKLDGTFGLKTFPYQSRYQICNFPSEPFLNQPTLGQNGLPAGSGFLVAPEVIATAGHCIDAASLPLARFVFGYRMLDAINSNLTIRGADVYRGVALIGRVYTPDGADWALVRLDRPVLDHQIASVRRSGRVPIDARLHVIGHPSELPLKVAGNARITNNTESTYLQATLDTFGGNSGSPVFNSLTHEVEGILVHGLPSFQSIGICQVSLVYPDTGPIGNDVTRSTQFASLLGPGWQQLDDNKLTAQIAASGSSLYQRHSNGELFQYTGTPMTGWARLDSNPQTAGLAVDGLQLYQRHHNGQIYRYTGVPMSGWAAVDTGVMDPAKSSKTIVAAGGQLYQRHTRGGFGATPVVQSCAIRRAVTG